MRTSGFSILELSVSVVILSIGLLGLSAVLISTTSSNHVTDAGLFMLDQSQLLMESIKETAPGAIVVTYDGSVTNLAASAQGAGVFLDGGTLSVTVDDSEPKLLVVTITGDWNEGIQTGSCTLRTSVYNP